MTEITCGNRLLKILDSLLLAAEAGALLMMQPTELLQDLSVVGIAVEDAHICALGCVVIFLLFVDVPNLEPDVFLTQWSWRISNNVLEALQALLKLLLLLVYYAESEVDLVGLFKVWFHAHDLGESLFGVFETAIAIVENADTVPKLWFLRRVSECRREFDWPEAYLWIWKMVKSLLVS